MIVSSSVGASHYHHRVTCGGRRRRVVDAVIIDGRLEKMGIGFDPNLDDFISFDIIPETKACELRPSANDKFYGGKKNCGDEG